MGGGGGGNNGPTLQQKQLQTQQAITTANLNLEENEQRKAILNAMQGTRVFRGSALSRAVAGNTPGSAAATGAPSNAQINSYGQVITPASPTSLLVSGSGATPAGGAGGSGGGGGGGRAGGAARGIAPGR